MNRRWITAVFWIVFLSVLGLSSRFPRLKAIWPAVLLLAVGGFAINYLVQVIPPPPGAVVRRPALVDAAPAGAGEPTRQETLILLQP